MRARLILILPPLVLLLCIGAAIYGLLAPWSAAAGVLRREHPANISLLIGGSYHSDAVDGVGHIERSADYVLIPDSFKALSTFSVHEDDGKFVLTELAYGLLFDIAFLIALVFGTWQSWKKLRRRQHGTVG